MSAHTPGPWSVDAGYGSYGVRIDGGERGDRAICGVIGVTRPTYSKDGRVIGEEDTTDGWANACLIAAAPELLEALEACHEALVSSGLAESWTVADEMARAAIAKATGAQP